MPAALSFLRYALPAVFGSTNRSNYNNNNYKGDGSYQVGGGRSPFSGNGIQKSVTHTVSYLPRPGDSDVVELMDVEKGSTTHKRDDSDEEPQQPAQPQYNRW